MPFGVLCFLSSYKALEKFTSRWHVKYLHCYHMTLCWHGICHRRVMVCVSVCLSVMAGIVSKRLNVGSRNQRHMIAQVLEVSSAKDLRKIEWGCQMHVGQG